MAAHRNGEFWGPWLRTEMGYVGVLTLMLAVIALALTFRSYPTTWFWCILGTLGLLTGLGGNAALHGWTYALVPFFRQLRVPARAIFLFEFSVAMLAAQGLDVLLRPLTRRARRVLASFHRVFLWFGGALAAVGVPLLGHAVIVSRTSPPDVLAQNVAAMGSVVFFLLLFGAGLGWLALRRHHLVRPVTLGILAVSLIAFDLISLGAYVETEPNDPLVGYRHESALDFLQADPEVFRVETAAEVQGGWAPDWALLYGMDDLSGIWNPLQLGAYNVLTWVGIGRDSPAYNLYNVKYLIARKDASVPAHFELAFDEGERAIYRNPEALPRAFMLYQVRVARGDNDALGQIRAADFRPATQIVLKKGAVDALGGEDALAVDSGDGERHVQIVSRGPNHLDFAVVTPVAGFLFVSEMWLPGWVAYVEGERQEVLQANYTFRAVHVPTGSHRVHMVYEPLAWFLGLGLTLTTLTALILWSVGAAVRRNRNARR